MYSLMIVDDEYMILRGMSKIVDWDDLDVKIVNEERSPLKALEYLKTHDVDILISDMNMAELEGTKFLPMVKKLQPDIQIVVLSGYNDFEYAKISLEQGVIDYLNKPVDPDELQEVIEKTKGVIVRAKRRKENSQMAKSVRIKDILNGRNSIGELDVDHHPYYLIAVANAGDDLRKCLVDEEDVVGSYFNNMDAYIIFGNNEDKLRVFANKLRKLNSTALISKKISEDEIASVAALLEKYLTWFHFYGPNNRVTNLHDFSYAKRPLDVAKMSNDLNFEDMPVTAFREKISNDLNLLRMHFNAIEDAKYYARLVLMAIYGTNQLVDANITDAVAKIEHTASCIKLADLLTTFYSNYRKNEQIYPEPINSVVKIIKHRYQESLTLTQVAGELHLSPVYLGALFKKHTDVSFAQFLNSYRVSKSIELMRSTDKDINDIALECGYQNANYFFRVFKKQTQMAPSEYKRMLKRH